MPLDTAGKDDVFVGRVRKDLADDCGLIIRNLNGDVETLYAGDVHIREMHA